MGLSNEDHQGIALSVSPGEHTLTGTVGEAVFRSLFRSGLGGR